MDFKFKTLIQLFDYFKDEKTCFEFLEQQIWGGIPACPHCGSIHVYTRKHRSKNPAKVGVNEYKCAEKGCNVNFTATVGTIFEGTKLPLRIWFGAIWLCTTSSKGISSLNLSKQLGITQKSAWFVLSRVREMFKTNAPTMLLSGTVEADETFVGGKESNKHVSKKTGGKGKNASKVSKRGTSGKTMVLGILQREGNVRTFVVPDTKADTLQPIMRANVETDSRIITDAHKSYVELRSDYNHVSVKHTVGSYITYRDEHTNNIEGYWSILKRGIIGVYHQVSRKKINYFCIMAKTKKEQPKNYADKVSIKGNFLDVFKVVKKDKERRAKEVKKKS